jgi:triphosphatase
MNLFPPAALLMLIMEALRRPSHLGLGLDERASSTVPVETEIKLQLLDNLSDRTLRSALRQAAGPTLPNARKQHLVSTYFDTAARDLAARHCTLRLRRAGDVVTQTIKVPVKAGSPKNVGLQTYHEYETPVTCERLDLSGSTAPGKAASWLRQLEPALRPAFATDIRRTAWLVERNESCIEIAWDRGEIRAERKAEPVNELELELKSGNRADLFALATTLTEHLPVLLGQATKAERGDALARDHQAGAIRARPLHLPADVLIGEACRRFALDCIGQMRANEPAILKGGHPEAVHQFRVALRRLRAMIGACRSLIEEDVFARWSADLRWAHQAFGRARDLDVLASATLEPLQHRFPEDRDLSAFAAVVAQARELAHAAARSAIAERRYTLALLDLACRLDSDGWARRSAAATLGLPAREFAVWRLQRRFKKVKSLAENWSGLTTAERHRLRIHVKKLRYLVGAFASLFPARSVRPFQQRLEQLQDVMGALNDAWVGEQYVDELSSTALAENQLAEGAVRHVRALLAGWYGRAKADSEGQFQSAWTAFAEQKRFWKS